MFVPKCSELYLDFKNAIKFYKTFFAFYAHAFELVAEMLLIMTKIFFIGSQCVNTH